VFFTALNGRAFLNSVTRSKTGVTHRGPGAERRWGLGQSFQKIKTNMYCKKSVDRANFILFWGCITRFSVTHIKFTELILSTVNLSCGCYNFECFSIAIDRFMLW